MWLINTTTLKLKEFPTEADLKYAILSHRWGDDEVLFRDLDVSKDLNLLQNKQGLFKVIGFCEQARRDQYPWAWVDTCCIDKSSSAELSEAINSMFHWYRESSMCYVYLSDVDNLDGIGGSEWFKRGWTLQELLAPTHVQFFGRDWTFLTDKLSLLDELAAITSIPERALLHFRSEDYCIADKMGWAIGRQTTREEDLAYCLMGLFDINMPLLYGERTKAFRRLQEKIMEFSTDLSIFLWKGQPCAGFGLLAASPSCFCVKLPYKSHSIPPRPLPPVDLQSLFNGIPHTPQIPTSGLRNMFNLRTGWMRNNGGISIRLSLRPYYINEDQKAIFVGVMSEPQLYTGKGHGIFLERLHRSCQEGQFRRVLVDNQTTISLVDFLQGPRHNRIEDFTTNLLIVQEPMTPSSSVGNGKFVVRWEAPKSLNPRVCQRPFTGAKNSLTYWPVIASELSTSGKFRFDYLRAEAQGILGYLLVSISDSQRLLVCFGYDVRFRPICVAVVCDESVFNRLRTLDIMRVYSNLFGDREQETEVFDSATGIHAMRASDDLKQFALFGDTLYLDLNIDTVALTVLPRFLEEQMVERRSDLRAEKHRRQRDIFHQNYTVLTNRREQTITK